MHSFDTRKYVFVFLITGFIFMTAFALSNYFSNRRLVEIRSIEDKIAIDILSSETQYALLQESSCNEISSSVLSEELGNLADKLSYTEGKLGKDTAEVIGLKRSYSLLEIKDYLLSKQISTKCGLRPAFVIYVYSNENDCSRCQETGNILTDLRETYPTLRVYSFDYHLDLSVIRTLLSIYKIKGELPALVINGTTYYGYRSKEELVKLLPRSITATSTPR